MPDFCAQKIPNWGELADFGDGKVGFDTEDGYGFRQAFWKVAYLT